MAGADDAVKKGFDGRRRDGELRISDVAGRHVILPAAMIVHGAGG